MFMPLRWVQIVKYISHSVHLALQIKLSLSLCYPPTLNCNEGHFHVGLRK